MAEPATRNESIALYQYMCQKIVGTEEHVKTIRMRNAVSDHLSSYDYMEMITSGSLGEGLEMRGSDIDKMRVMTFIEVCENTSVPMYSDKTYFTMETVDAQSGFTQLRLIHINKRLNMLELCEEIGGEYYFSNMTFKQRYSNKFCPIIHGPCLSDREGIFDYANCLHCRSWITQAHQWIKRANNSWPGCDVKQSIINHGVLFVPKGVQGSTKEDLEWRISFSVGEKLLIYTFTHTQLLCYALMKILLKDVINIDLDCKELLCSYFMKTILFWISEEFPVSIWSPKNLISNFIMYLQRLIYCVEYSVCPHYFIPENNLFENKIAGCKKETLMRKLNYLTSYGWKCLLFSDQFNELAFHIHKDASLFYDNILKQILSPIRDLTDISIYISLSSLRKQFHKMLSFQSSNIKYLYSLYISTICSHTVQFIPFNLIDDNKSTYKQYKKCISNLLLCTRHDAVSGWLMVASFFYHTKQYQRALDVLKYSLMKCSPENKYNVYNLSDIHYEIFRLSLLKQINTVQISKLLLVNEVWFFENSWLAPKELLIGQHTTGYQIPPVVYAHFLGVLCHYHMNSMIQCRHSLQDVQLTIEEEYFIPSVGLKAESYHILGIIFQLLGDIDSARQACINSIELFPDPDLNSASKRLLILDSIQLC